MTTSVRIESDVVIVGSGIGGATTAFGLAQKGVKTLVLERGERMPREPENWSPSEIFMKSRYKPNEKWEDEKGKLFVPGVHYFVGGNSKVYGASLPRFSRFDFDLIEHQEGASPAWPFTYDELEPYYYKAEELYRVHGDAQNIYGNNRTTPFPYPAMAHEPYVAELGKRLTAAGVHPHSNSMGIDLGPGGKCIRCKKCDGFVCKLDAKSDAEVNALNPAMATGNVKLMTSVQVNRIVLNDDHRSVSHLEATRNGEDLEIYGKKFVISAGSVNTAALLLRSGVANSSDQVGRNFMMHNNSHIAAVDMRRKNDVTFQKTLSFTDWYLDGGKGYPLGAVQLIGKVQGIMMKSFAKRIPIPLLNFVADHSVEFVVMSEDLPHPENRVTISASGSIKIARQAVGMRTHMELLRRTKRVLRKAGYQGIFRQPFDISMNSHQCGTTVAGVDPQTSVVDGYSRSHDHKNLYLIDGGFFPSSAAMNPALTIAAQALRVVAESDLSKV